MDFSVPLVGDYYESCGTISRCNGSSLDWSRCGTRLAQGFVTFGFAFVGFRFRPCQGPGRSPSGKLHEPVNHHSRKLWGHGGSCSSVTQQQGQPVCVATNCRSCQNANDYKMCDSSMKPWTNLCDTSKGIQGGCGIMYTRVPCTWDAVAMTCKCVNTVQDPSNQNCNWPKDVVLPNPPNGCIQQN